MSNKSGLAPVICERCERVFRGGVNAYFCPACRKQIQSENARKIGLSERGREARRERNPSSVGCADTFPQGEGFAGEQCSPLQGVGETHPLRSEDGRCGQRPLREETEE